MYLFFKFSNFLDLLFQSIGKSMFVVVMSHVHFDRALLCYSNSNILILRIKKKQFDCQKQSHERLTILKYIQVYWSRGAIAKF